MIGDHGLYAVFGLMLIDAVLPAASEVVMVYAGRGRRRRIRRAVGDAVRPHVRGRLPRVPRHGPRGDGRLPDRLDRRLGDRRLRRAPVPRAPRPLAAPRRDQARPSGAMVRPLGQLGRVPRSHHPGHSLVHLRSRRRVPLSVPALRRAHGDRLCAVVLRLRRRRLGGRSELGGVPRRRSSSSTTRWPCSSWQGSPSWGGSWSRRRRAA